MDTLDDGIYNTSRSFDSVPTANPQDIANTGSSIASFRLGLPSTGSNQAGDTAAYIRRTDHAIYGQDDIKVTRKFTLDLGLRR